MFKVGDVGYTYDKWYGIVKCKVIDIRTYDKIKEPYEIDFYVIEYPIFDNERKRRIMNVSNIKMDELFKTQREVIQRNYEKWNKYTSSIENEINTTEDLINFMYLLIPKDEHTMLETEVIKSKAKELLNIDIKGE